MAFNFQQVTDPFWINFLFPFFTIDLPIGIFSMTIPQREIERTNNDRTAPLRTPTHIGCAFSIDREFFYEIGSYDEKMDIWGSENLEMAIRVSKQNRNSRINFFLLLK